MNKEIRMVILEIIFVVFIMFIGSYIYNYFSLSVNEERALASKYESRVAIEFVDENKSIVKVKNNTNEMINCDFILRMNKNSNFDELELFFNGISYRLIDLEYDYDNDYLYYKLDRFRIGNKEQFFVVDLRNNSNEDIINYGYMISEV